MLAAWSAEMDKREKTIAQGPFSDLERQVKKAGFRLLSTPIESISKPLPTPILEVPQAIESEEAVFAEAMDGVKRAAWRHPPPEIPPLAAPVPSHDPESEERRLMEAAMEGIPAMTVLDHPEYIEGWIGVAGKRFLPNLRNGLYSIQGQIDLHGLTQEEARRTVEEFVVHMSRFRSCCVKIIHGRGMNSPNDRAVLKESLQRWLSMRRMSRHVVAYASAPLKDGGVGAVYVLLRRL
jgi:DNA-nicking Smr family endonuclease